MSVQASTWAFRQERLAPGAKLLLVTIANAADVYGVTYQGRAKFAAQCCYSEKSVSANMARLEEEGLIARRQRRRRNGSRTSDFIILAPRRPDRGPLEDAPGEEFSEEIASLARRGEVSSGEVSSGEVSAPGQVNFLGGPDPSVDPSESFSGRAREGGAQTQGTLEGSDAPAPQPKNATMKADGKVVSKQERLLAVEVLSAFNRRAGTTFRSVDFVKKIVLRIREHPEMGLAGHRSVIERAFEKPWWKGTPNPSVVYGNAGLFETMVQAKDTRAPVDPGFEDSASFGARMNAKRIKDTDV